MKESNVAIVFILSCIAGLQLMSRQRLFLIAWIMLGSFFCVSADANFIWVGFICQATSQITECLRAVLAEMFMKGSFKIDPFSYTLLVSPVCLVFLITGTVVTWKPEVWTDFKVWWPMLVPNACLAFILNLCIANVVRETSAVGFNLTGLVKDVCLVVFSAVAFSDPVQMQQWVAFGITLSGVYAWSLLKISPDHVFFARLDYLLCVTRNVNGKDADSEEQRNEKTPLIKNVEKPNEATV
jgi:drug/metabolite transporter (DMT)-like permease